MRFKDLFSRLRHGGAKKSSQEDSQQTSLVPIPPPGLGFMKPWKLTIGYEVAFGDIVRSALSDPRIRDKIQIDNDEILEAERLVIRYRARCGSAMNFIETDVPPWLFEKLIWYPYRGDYFYHENPETAILLAIAKKLGLYTPESLEQALEARPCPAPSNDIEYKTMKVALLPHEVEPAIKALKDPRALQVLAELTHDDLYMSNSHIAKGLLKYYNGVVPDMLPYPLLMSRELYLSIGEMTSIFRTTARGIIITLTIKLGYYDQS